MEGSEAMEPDIFNEESFTKPWNILTQMVQIQMIWDRLKQRLANFLVLSQVQSYVDNPSIMQLPQSQQESVAISRTALRLQT